MKQLEEEFGSDCAVEMETDDEETEAERCDNHDDGTECDNTDPRRFLSNDCLNHDSISFRPRSYSGQFIVLTVQESCFKFVTPVTKFDLSTTPVALGLEELLPTSHLRSDGVSILVRTSLVASTLIVALPVPYFGSVMALIGSFLVMLVPLVLPCACYMRIDKEWLTKLQIATCSFIMVVGVCCAIIGTYAAVTNMGD